MRLAGQQFVLYGDEAAWITVYGIGDIHLGNKASSVDVAADDVEWIRSDPMGLWLGVGDYAEYINHLDPRFDPDCVAEYVSVSDLGKLGVALTDKVAAMFRPIRHKCLGLCFGNHEAKYMRMQSQKDMHDAMCMYLEVPNLEYSAAFDLVFLHCAGMQTATLSRERPDRDGVTETWRRRFFVHHGAGAAQSPGGKYNRLYRSMEVFEADVAFIGHCHDSMVARRVRVGANEACTETHQTEQRAAMCGSYLRTYAPDVTTYGEMRMYQPVPFGPGVARFHPKSKRFRVEV